MKKFLFVFSFLSLFAMTQMQAQDKACCSTAPPTCCKISADQTAKTVSTDATTCQTATAATAVHTAANKECCPVWMQKLCKELGVSCDIAGQTATATKVAATAEKTCKKMPVCQAKKESTSEEL